MNTAIATRDDSAQLPAAPQNETVALLDMISRAASDPTVDVEKMERLMAMRERILARKAEAEFNDALAQAQAVMGPISTDAENSQTHSKYASYKRLDKVLRPIYTNLGFALSFSAGDGAPPEHVRVLCHVTHRGGHTKTYQADMPADGKGAKGNDVMTKTHATGSAFTYAQRYLLKLIFNVAIGELDDDGNAAAGTVSEAQKGAIIDLLKETGGETKRFLTFMGVKSVDEIPAAKFRTAIDAIEKKRVATQKQA